MVETIKEEAIPDQKQKANRNEKYWEEIVPRYSPSEFKNLFRMTPQSMENLLSKVAPFMVNKIHIFPLSKKLQFTVWMLATQDSFLAGGDKFDLAKSSGHVIFREVICALLKLMPQYIKWPRNHNLEQIAKDFEVKSKGIPGVIGAIDGCHIQIKQPAGNETDFYNRKGFHSIILQGVSISNLLFTDISVGDPGRVHDARVLRNSLLFQRLSDTRNPLLTPKYHIIGDSAYPLSNFLLTPYRDNGHLTEDKIRFNSRLSSIRSCVERAFGHLKGRFRRLKYLDISDLELANEIIAVSCVLHNFVIMEGDSELDDDIGELFVPEIELEEEINSFDLLSDKRNYIASILE